MELVLFFVLVMLSETVLYLILCLAYFLATARPVSLAFKLSWKLALGTIVGAPLLGFGAVLVPAILFNGAVEPIPNYSKGRDIIAAFLLGALGAVVLFFLALSLAWEVFN